MQVYWQVEPTDKNDLPASANTMAIARMIVIDPATPDELKPHFQNKHGLAISVCTGEKGTRNWRRLGDAVLKTAEKYPRIKVHPFGTNALYPASDAIVVWGKVVNTFQTNGLVYIICTISVFLVILTIRKKHITKRIKNIGRMTGRELTVITFISSKMGLTAIVPFVFATMCLILTMMERSLALAIATACISAFCLAAAIDFSIYMQERYVKMCEIVKTQQEALKLTLDAEAVLVWGRLGTQQLILPTITL